MNTLALFVLIIAILLFILRRAIYPRPLPDIPYNKEIGLFGDLPTLGQHVLKTNHFWSWLSSQNAKHQAPLVQVFMTPFSSKPMLVLADAREAQDVMLRRAEDFDRSDFSKGFIRGIVPKGMFTLSSDHEWRAHRALTKDLMTPAFLRSVSGPAVFVRAIDLINLWHTKAQLAQGKPFAADLDIHFCALDAIFDAAFGTEDGLKVLQAREKHLKTTLNPTQQHGTDEFITFSEPKMSSLMRSIILLNDSTEYALQSMVPKLAWAVLAWVPWYSAAWKEKEEMIGTFINKARNRIERKTTKENEVRCAVDHIVAREMALAAKANRVPEYNTRDFRDEVFGYIVGGYDTTSTTTRWGVKYLSRYQDAQTKFRAALYDALPEVRKEGRQPSLEEIWHLKSPYVDAILEEMIRHSQTLPGSQRQATRDTTLLGHHIPKGTEVFVLANGPDFFSPGFSVPEEKRSTTSQEALKDGRTYGTWDKADLKSFKPERWLVKQEDESVHFNRMAGLHLTFGLGPRGCFGRKLAELEFKVFLCLMVWNFYFDPVEGELASDDYNDKLTRMPKKCFVKLRPVV